MIALPRRAWVRFPGCYFRYWLGIPASRGNDGGHRLRPYPLPCRPLKLTTSGIQNCKFAAILDLPTPGRPPTPFFLRESRGKPRTPPFLLRPRCGEGAMPNRHTPSPLPSPTRDRPAVGGRRRSISPSHVGSGSRPEGGGSRSPSPVQERSSRYGVRNDGFRDGSPSQPRSRSRPATSRRSRSRSLSSSRSRSRSRDRAGAKPRSSRPGIDSGRSRRRRSRSRSRSRSSSRSDSRSRSQLRRDCEDAKSKARHEGKKEAAVKTSAMFLGAIAVTTLAVHKFWPKGFPYGDKEEWETREIPKHVQKSKEDLFEKREEVHQKIEDMTHGRRPMLEGRPGRSGSTASVGSSNGRRYAEYDRERIYYEDRQGRRFLPVAREREERPGFEQETIWVDREGYRVDPPPRHERVYRRQETHYRGDDAPYGDTKARLVSRSREEAEVHQPPARNSRPMLEDVSQRPRDIPWENDERRMLQDTSSRSSMKYAEPGDLGPPRYEKVTARQERMVVNERAFSPPGEWDRDTEIGRDRRLHESTKERHHIAENDRLSLHDLERNHEQTQDPPLREITTERREIVRGRDPSLGRSYERPRDHDRIQDPPSKEIITERREIVRGRDRSLDHDYERPRDHDRIQDPPSREIITERREVVRGRDPSPDRDYDRPRDRTPKRKVIETQEIIREKATSPPLEYHRESERARELDFEPNIITVERHEKIRQRDISPRGHKPVKDRPKETIVEEHEIVRGRAPSPARGYEDEREYNMTMKKVTRERREEIRDRSPSPDYEYERTREQPREFREERRVIRERGISPPREWDRPRERRSNHEAVGPIEVDFLDLPVRTRRNGASPMPHSRRGDRERMRDEDLAYY
ncbi:hypothetical protein MGG_16852 [Pyricularia oryzae 70-15]|uniref:Uncharacterized protein n=2 Tax=Pyricularia oryzae (strain 70-15 / ATCC MYA-4617 / FGSC 8958) TaxID=242507 RepID=G4N434_PYRO7|nr:uncharacterized protein MGG_16852 [Pyricularia oryzae 70-15]EHA52755.1 hypothetical protein MGG_16852 [Pyricularia oryzae 70-15]